MAIKCSGTAVTHRPNFERLRKLDDTLRLLIQTRPKSNLNLDVMLPIDVGVRSWQCTLTQHVALEQTRQMINLELLLRVLGRPKGFGLVAKTARRRRLVSRQISHVWWM